MNDLKFTTAGDYMVTDTKFDDLMYRAGLTAQGCWDEMDDYDRKAIEKFAELIVRECGEVAYKAYWDNPETVKGIHIQEKIKQHFGVE
jgi:hypothetical protein